jgi:localization factor PodJL
VRQRRRSYREPDDDEDVRNDDFAAVNDRLDDLTRQLERMARANVAQPPAPAPTSIPPPAPTFAPPSPQIGPDRVAVARARLDRRLDQVIADGRAAVRYARPAPVHAHPAPAPAAYAPRAMAPQQAPQPSGPAGWAAQISARQRMLDGGPVAAPASHPVIPPQALAPPHASAPPLPAPQPNWGPGPEFAEVEHQLREINSQIQSLHQPYENALAALRSDLAEIGQTLTEAMPRRAIETLEAEVRSLADRVGRTKQAGADGAALAAIEREIAEVRNALQHMTPAEGLAGFHEAVQALSHKIDQIGTGGGTPQDPMAFKQLEQAVVSLRGVVSNVASDGALAQLAAEVRGMAAQFESAATDSGTEALGRLESRIAALMESGRSLPPELEGSIRDLSTKLDRMQLSQGDQLALGALEDRIAQLSAKLDASDSRLASLAAMERGMAELLVHLEEMRSTRSLRAPQPPEPAPAPAAPPPPMPVTPASAPAFAPAAVELQPQAPHPMPMPAPAPVLMEAIAPPPVPTPAPVETRAPPPKQMPRGPQRQPIDPNLPPDAPLEPGSGAPRVKPGSAAARIAASEAALGYSRPTGSENGGKSAAIAAARNAAKAAYLDTPVKVPKSLGPKPIGRFKWPFKRSKGALPPAPQLQTSAPPPPVLPPLPTNERQPQAGMMPPPIAERPVDDMTDAPLSRGRKILKLMKTLLIAASVAIIVVGTAQTAIELLFPDKPASPATQPSAEQPAKPAASMPAPSAAPTRPMPTPDAAPPPPPPPATQPADPATTNSINKSIFDPATVIKLPDVTGSIPRKPLPPKPATAPAGHTITDALPSSIGPVLKTALLASNPAAEYELGLRYIEGRGVPQSIPEATVWLQRAADTGFAPAQFRLASLYEKGDGLKKDLQAARRLYIDAARKGHAKAMHNLAVLYAEGIDGKPDYKTAAEWFRRAAGYGVTDSQYNLAILYARGIGVQANLAESYRWFSLAAAKGDRDASRKRDEVAARLDQKIVMAAKLAAQTFVPENEPDEAINLNTPPGGWDHVPAQPAKPRHHNPATSAR